VLNAQEVQDARRSSTKLAQILSIGTAKLPKWRQPGRGIFWPAYEQTINRRVDDNTSMKCEIRDDYGPHFYRLAILDVRLIFPHLHGII
jgi:hypothetical protein